MPHDPTGTRRASERDIQSSILLHHGRGDARLFRQNTGMAWTGTVTERTAHSITIMNPRPFHAGLCLGSSDIIGWRTVEITPAMVGERLAVFVAIEAKRPGGRVTPEQQRFIDAVTKAGGYAGVARSVEEAGRILYVEPTR